MLDFMGAHNHPIYSFNNLHNSVFLYLIYLFKPQQYQPNHLLTLAYNHSKSNEYGY